MSKTYKFVVLANASDGKDAEFNAWHSDTHLPEVVRAAGFTRAERMRLVPGTSGDGQVYQYLIVFEGHGDEPMDSLQRLGAAMAGQKITMSDSLGAPVWSSLFEEIPGASFLA
jgi:hypothetical protein